MTEANLKDIEKLFVEMAGVSASDLHLKAGQKPILRVSTEIRDFGQKALSSDDIKQWMYSIMTDTQINRFEKENDLDFAYSLSGVGRFRINLFKDRGSIATAIRRVNTRIPTYAELNLPDAVKNVASFNQGLVIVAGPTGCGKSTTLACIIDSINQSERLHIITIEDPIEYLFQNKKSFISQREIGIDVDSFPVALKHIVRQDPDVILVGEMRDRESFEAALTASETGHIVFGTIHASSAAQTIERLLELFPTERQPLIRQGLSFNLRAVICQKLLPSCKEEIKVVPAIELMFASPSIQKLIQNAEDKKIQDVIRSSAEEGMRDFNQSLLKLINTGFITRQVALSYSPNPDQLKMNLQGIFLGEERRIIG